MDRDISAAINIRTIFSTKNKFPPDRAPTPAWTWGTGWCGMIRLDGTRLKCQKVMSFGFAVNAANKIRGKTSKKFSWRENSSLF